ncbi:GtrA family protein [Halomonas sp. ATBC28]|uniref:GtrA family protein n=1 Tax=Halomonadaceae TaxID=28256 RepID=UPI000687B48F|nr:MULTISPECIES: GtrA family protein [Halomonas]NAO96745.1 GtrA family protein [Halomonas sp. MG34]PKH63303.1 GtrA family protein [Halomonas sp. Choline-3u-9]QGQ69958.1 GtrA family protein [Halomonas sp. PA16-9]TMU17984.1 GtrA family protein [Halomonas sp. ATBC28]
MRRLVRLFNRDVFRLFRFLIVGGAATVTHMLVAALLFAYVHNPSPYSINVVAFLVAFLVSFYGHRHITFQTRGSMRRFLLVAVGGFLVNNAILTGCLALGIDGLVAVIIATACVPVLTYLASSLWAFKTEEK